MTARAHVAALLDALTAAGLAVYDGDAPVSASMPYVVVYSAVGRGLAERLDAKPDRLNTDVQITSVGLSRVSAAIVGERARDVTLSRHEVAGRNTWRGIHLDSQPIRRDQDVADLEVFYGVDRYRLCSVTG